MTDVNEFLAGSGVPSFKFEKIGDSVDGIVTRAEVRQQTDFETGQLVTWDDGTPKMQLIVDLQTTLFDENISGDDGLRRIYLRNNALTAVRQAVKAAGGRLETGGALSVKYVKDGEPPKKGFHGPKLFEAEYKAGATGVDVDALA